MQTADFDFALPEALIAQTPPARRSDARLLVLRRSTGEISHHVIGDLAALLARGDLLVLNDTRVLPARLFALRESGGRVELLLLHPSSRGAGTLGASAAPSAHSGGDLWTTLVRPARRIKPGEALRLILPDTAGAPARSPLARLVRHLGEGEAEVRFEGPGTDDLPALLRKCGQMPLPPYIRTRLDDPERYQTVYARVEGSAAAPTAGLHFTPDLLAALEAEGICRTALTLHVGLGTFRPVSAERPEEHHIHSEWFQVGAEVAREVAAARARHGRVVAVGTTVVRSLETLATENGHVPPGSGWTDLFILPGRPFRAVDALLTNFHLPRSTLLMLVCAFGGQDAVLAAYREAVRLRYRFFSFGDAMLIL